MAPPRRPGTAIGLDVGKSSHWACVATRDGEVLLSAHEASKLFGGDAKTDERDATVIIKTALGIPDALPPVAHPDPAIAAARSIAAQRDFLIYENTRNKNRLRSILLESCPEFEALVDLSDAAELRLMAAPAARGRWPTPAGARPRPLRAGRIATR